MCGRVRESFLFFSIQGCYLLEIQHIFYYFFFSIDFSRVGGKTLQMREKKRKKKKMQAGQEDFGEPQVCFGLGLQAEKDSSQRPQPVWPAKMPLFRPERSIAPFPLPPPSGSVLPLGGRQPPRVTSHSLPCPVQVRRGVCWGRTLLLLRRARPREFTLPCSPLLLALPTVPERAAASW